MLPQRSLTILLSAYACEPGLGSEAAVGWSWASELGRAHDVQVITREANRPAIEAELAARPLPGVRFSYFDLPRWLRAWKRGNRGVHLYYFIWQIGAFLVARQLQKRRRFDVVHHVTFVSIGFPSFMALLGPPFIFGPVAGGEYSPRALWWSCGWRARLREMIRYVSLHAVRYSPLMWLTFARSSRIFVTSRQTAACVPRRFQARTRVMLGVGSSSAAHEAAFPAPGRAPRGTFRVLFAGRLTYLKGMELGLRAFGRLSAQFPDCELTLIGDGPERTRWQAQAKALGIAGKVQWRPALARAEFLRVLPQFDALLFPAFHDSGGMVVLESLAAGLPVVCLDVGGPGELVTESCGFKVPLGTPEQIVENLARALLALAEDPHLQERMGRSASKQVAEQHSWEVKAREMARVYAEVAASRER